MLREEKEGFRGKVFILEALSLWYFGFVGFCVAFDSFGVSGNRPQGLWFSFVLPIKVN